MEKIKIKEIMERILDFLCLALLVSIRKDSTMHVLQNSKRVVRYILSVLIAQQVEAKSCVSYCIMDRSSHYNFTFTPA